MDFSENQAGAWILGGILLSPVLFWLGIKAGKLLYVWLH